MLIAIGITQFLTFLANAILGVFILFKNPRSNLNRAFSLFAFATAGWILALYLAIFRFTDTLIAGRFTFFFASLMGAGLIWFTAEFPVRTAKLHLAHKLAIALGLVIAALALSPYMVLTAEIREDMYIFGTFNGLPYLLWIVSFLGSLFYSLFQAWRGAIRSTGVARSQYRMFAIGVTVFMLAIIGTNLLIPIFLEDFRWNSIGPIFSIFLISFVANAIITYRFLEIRWVLRRSIDVLFLFGGALLIVYGFQFLLGKAFSAQVIDIATAVTIALFFVPAARYISNWTAHLMSRGSYFYRDAVAEISEFAHDSMDLAKLQRSLADKIEKYYGFSRIAVVSFVSDDTGAVAKGYVRGFKNDILKAAPEALRLCGSCGSDLIEAAELRWRLENGIDRDHADHVDMDGEMLRFLQTWGISDLVPFCVGKSIVGMAFCGEKQKRTILSEQDIALLHVMRGSVAPAMANGIRFAEIQKLYARLSELDRAKSDFISVVSHQFRTPLTSILWNTEIFLEEPGVSKKKRDVVIDIQRRAEFLNTTLSGLLDMIELDSNKITFEKKPVDLERVVGVAVGKCDGYCKDARVTYAKGVAPLLVIGDEKRIAFVVSVLLMNACKYTDEHKKITVDLRKDASGHHAELVIADEGIGISQADLPHLYEKFFRGGNALQAVADGTGVGMYMVKKIIEKQHGTISVLTKEGKGTTFTVTFPLVSA